MIWFTSDTHYQHKNICEGVSDWEGKEGCRKFKTLQEMNDKIVENINKYVLPDDTLYHLGDWSFGGIEQIWEFREKVNCNNIHLILGNHDHHIELNHSIILQDKQHSCQEMFASVSHYKEVKINGRRFILCHYAMRVWRDSHKGSTMLYGHSHGTLDNLKPNFADPTWIGENYYIKNCRTMDVGIDAHPEFRPFSITEIINIMKERDVLLIDHHNENTN